MSKTQSQTYFYRPSWMEVDLDAIAANLAQVRANLGAVQLCAVVKADAYGLGAIEVARWLEQQGVQRLAVVTLDEAIELRRAGVHCAILNMGAIFPDQAEAVVEYHLEQMAFQSDVMQALNARAAACGTEAVVHVKVDTGMSRYGVSWRDAIAAVEAFSHFRSIRVAGAMTHFPMSDGLDKSFALLQMERFKAIRSTLQKKGISIPLWHMCNSGGVLDLPQAHLDMVRVGLLLYGYYPSSDVNRPFQLQPAARVVTRIAALRTIQRGDTVGYGRRFMAEKEERIAVLPIGYADGYDRKLRNIGEVLIQGRRATLAGGLCMDACFVRVTDFPHVRPGDEVTLMGREGGEEISPHDIARKIDSVSYEVLARWGRRLPRVYLRDGKVTEIRNPLL